MTTSLHQTITIMEPLHAFTPVQEIKLRTDRIRKLMEKASVDAILISTNANIYYTTGRVFDGYVYIPAEGGPLYFVRKPVGLEGEGVVKIHKPEQIMPMLAELGIAAPKKLGPELALSEYLTVKRLEAAFPDSTVADASAIMREARSVKTDYEVEQIRRSGMKHCTVYKKIPKLYREGMSDVELQIEIERTSRLEGCLGQFRVAGSSMEIHMGSVLAGPNADSPSPYDFSMGGAGVDPSLPVGADGTIIQPGMTVMVDTNGDFTGYMSDLTRVYTPADISPLAQKAHQCSIDICHAIEKAARPGVKASDLYELAQDMAKSRSLEHYFMGHRQKAGFIGHGVGIDINEMPVLSPRSRDILQLNNVIAVEPKFVIPEVGAVGIENTYVVRADGLECLTDMTEQIIRLQ